jgi:hypothetical protein
MSLIRGNAAFTWTSTGEDATERVLLLREPLRELRPAHRMAVYVRDSLDYSVREVFHVGDGAQELVARARFVDDGQGLSDMLRAGSQGLTLTYHPDLDDPERTHAFKLLAPMSPFQLDLDPDAGPLQGDVEVELMLRYTT